MDCRSSPVVWVGLQLSMPQSHLCFKKWRTSHKIQGNRDCGAEGRRCQDANRVQALWAGPEPYSHFLFSPYPFSIRQSTQQRKRPLYGYQHACTTVQATVKNVLGKILGVVSLTAPMSAVGIEDGSLRPLLPDRQAAACAMQDSDESNFILLLSTLNISGWMVLSTDGFVITSDSCPP